MVKDEDQPQKEVQITEGALSKAFLHFTDKKLTCETMFLRITKESEQAIDEVFSQIPNEADPLVKKRLW